MTLARRILVLSKDYLSSLSRHCGSKRFTAPELSAMVFLLVFFIFRLPYFLGGAYVPDEQVHTHLMEHAFKGNYEAFGAAYWFSGHILIKVFGADALAVMRFLAFVSIMYTAFAIYRIASASNKSIAPLVFVFVLSSPVFWFGGKLITPEFYQFGLLSIVAVQLFCKKSDPWWTYLLLGFVSGIKLSSITIVLFVGLIHLSQSGYLHQARSSYKKLSKILALLILGYIASSPNILFDPSAYMRMFFSNFGHPNGPPANFWTMKMVTWDYIQNWGVLHYLNPLVILMFAIFMIATRNWKILVLALACMGLFLLLLFRNNYYLAWHAFPTAALLWFGFALAQKRESTSNLLLHFCLVMCIALNLITVAQQAPVDWRVWRDFLSFEKNRNSDDDCFRRFSHDYASRQAAPGAVMCYGNYRVNQKHEGFCDAARLSAVMNTDTWHPEILQLGDGSGAQFKALLRQGPVVFLVNEQAAINFGRDLSEENTYLRAMLEKFRQQEAFVVTSTKLGMCGPYQIIEYRGSLVGVAMEK